MTSLNAKTLLILFCLSVRLYWKELLFKGTEYFDVNKGAFTDMGVLDVQQIFGRAGRPQFEDSGMFGVISKITDILFIVAFKGKLNIICS